jgi:hypothetical protein
VGQETKPTRGSFATAQLYGRFFYLLVSSVFDRYQYPKFCNFFAGEAMPILFLMVQKGPRLYEYQRNNSGLSQHFFYLLGRS